MTFSIAARCAETGMLGVAVSTCVPAVGSVCPFAAPNVGAVATQSWLNPYHGIDALQLLSRGRSPDEAIEEVLSEDPGRNMRQLGVVDAHGNSASYTGSECVPYFGHMNGDNYSVQGNMLTGEEPLVAMEDSFKDSGDTEFTERLLRSLEAGQAVGGDFRGRQSAAMVVYRTEQYPFLELRVDEHRDPVAELRRIYGVWRRQTLPFVEMMPTRDNPIDGHDPEIANYILLSPEERDEVDARSGNL